MGVKKTGDLLERLTWGFIVAIMVIALGTNMVAPGVGQGDDILERVKPQANPSGIENTNVPAATDSTGK